MLVSPRRASFHRQWLPRYWKGYLWICVLVTIFLLMALTENGAFDQARGDKPHSQKMYDGSRALDINEPQIHHLDDEMRPPARVDAPLDHASSIAVHEPVKSEVASVIPDGQAMPVEQTPMLNTGLSPDDVLIVLKTGATSLWRRLPIHLSTTLASKRLTPHVVIYSDSPDQIVEHPVVDALANVSRRLKDSADFRLYGQAAEHARQNLYLESGSMEGDSYLPGGWRLDKYKFLPAFAHAARAHPGKQWYVYMEDDNYFFWEALYAWLHATYGARDARGEPLFVGSPAFRLGEDFAHGGSGFAVNGAAMRRVFGARGERGDELVAHYEEYMLDVCCGDQILSHVFAEAGGVARDRTFDGTGTAPLQALSLFRLAVGAWNYCSPLLNMHKVHQRDVSRLHAFEAHFKAHNPHRPVPRYGDFFAGFVAPGLNASRLEWDNYAAAKHFSSTAEEQHDLAPAARAQRPWYSAEQCRRACVAWDQCLSWKYADDNCFLDHTVAMGQKVDEGIRLTSGWMLDRIATLEETSCD